MREATRPSRVTSLRTIGITGSGDTVATSYLVTNVLATAGYSPGLVGSLGCFDGVDLVASRWTTPPSSVLSRWLARIRQRECSHAALEISGRAVREARPSATDFHVVALQDLPRRRHAGVLPSRESLSLVDQLLPEGFAIARGDDPRADFWLSRHDGPALTVGIGSPAELTAVRLTQATS